MEKKKPIDDFLSALGAPARRSLELNRITTLEVLCRYSEAEILKLHSIGPSTIPKLRRALSDRGLSFRD